jgi:hypothetical protein
VRPDRWEHGSEFHWPSLEGLGGPAARPWRPSGLLLGAGRDAFRVLLDHGRSERGWRRLRIPSYFCQEVVAALLDAGLPVDVYEDRPTAPGDPLPTSRDGDVVLIVNTFALRSKPPSYRRPPGVEIIEDHTHDPSSLWAQTSEADWCVASLRKVLPVPDGGALWSPRDHRPPAPPETCPEHEGAALRKLAAMTLKSAYLDGSNVSKDEYRDLAVTGEAAVAGRTASAMPTWSAKLLDAFPSEDWWRRKGKNFGAFLEALGDVPRLQVLQPASNAGIPFSAVVLFPSREVRDRLRAGLVAERIYPAVLWQMDSPAVEGIPDGCRDLAATHLSIHCDFRYTREDMVRVAEALKRLMSQCP